MADAAPLGISLYVVEGHIRSQFILSREKPTDTCWIPLPIDKSSYHKIVEIVCEAHGYDPKKPPETVNTDFAKHLVTMFSNECIRLSRPSENIDKGQSLFYILSLYKLVVDDVCAMVISDDVSGLSDVKKPMTGYILNLAARKEALAGHKYDAFINELLKRQFKLVIAKYKDLARQRRKDVCWWSVVETNTKAILVAFWFLFSVIDGETKMLGADLKRVHVLSTLDAAYRQLNFSDIKDRIETMY